MGQRRGGNHLVAQAAKKHQIGRHHADLAELGQRHRRRQAKGVDHFGAPNAPLRQASGSGWRLLDGCHALDHRGLGAKEKPRPAFCRAFRRCHDSPPRCCAGPACQARPPMQPRATRRGGRFAPGLGSCAWRCKQAFHYTIRAQKAMPAFRLGTLRDLFGKSDNKRAKGARTDAIAGKPNTRSRQPDSPSRPRNATTRSQTRGPRRPQTRRICHTATLPPTLRCSRGSNPYAAALACTSAAPTRRLCIICSPR